MAKNSKIDWTDHTFNPWTGCAKVSTACENCYAEGWAKRSGVVKWGNAERRRTSVSNWMQPIKWNAEAKASGIRYRVFCASLADVFDNAVPSEWRADLFALIRATPYLDWLLLTKRIGNANKLIADALGALPPDLLCGTVQHNNAPVAQWPWKNVWIGATICNQEEADRDIHKLMRVPAVKRFLSMEPLLSAVNLNRWFDIDTLDWVIVGGESGQNARPMHPDWVRNLRDQCVAAQVPFFFKQHGEWREPLTGEEFDTSKGRTAKPPAFILSEDGTVHCFQNNSIINGKIVIRVGKEAAGRSIDDKKWGELPCTNKNDAIINYVERLKAN